jgi:hypothetical protein
MERGGGGGGGTGRSELSSRGICILHIANRVTHVAFPSIIRGAGDVSGRAGERRDERREWEGGAGGCGGGRPERRLASLCVCGRPASRLAWVSSARGGGAGGERAGRRESDVARGSRTASVVDDVVRQVQAQRDARAPRPWDPRRGATAAVGWAARCGTRATMGVFLRT